MSAGRDNALSAAMLLAVALLWVLVARACEVAP